MSQTVSSATPLDHGSAKQSSSKGMIWMGRVLSTLVVLFLTMDGIMKLLKPDVVVKGTMELGFAESVIVPLGIVLLVSTLLYALPQTAVLGAILLTGYLGGAVATHVRHGDPLLSRALFPTYLGAILWLGLVLRDSRIRALLPFRSIR
jgi:hypothetical protein